MITILNIETSGTSCSVSLSINDKVISLKETNAGKSHASLLTPFIDEVLKNANISFQELNAVSVSKGPGSYTGLRIGVSTAKGIAYALELPVIGINSLKILTYGFIQNYPEYNGNDDILFCPMIDARRMEVYTSLFTSSLKPVTQITAEIINENTFNSFLSGKKIIFFGDGAPKGKSIITDSNAQFIEFTNLSAKYMNTLSLQAFKEQKFENTAYFEPFYLKDFIAGIPKKKGW